MELESLEEYWVSNYPIEKFIYVSISLKGKYHRY